MKLRTILLIAFIPIFIATPSLSQTVKLHIENDIFAGTDRYYTHATRIDYLFPSDDTPQSLEFLKLNPLFPLESKEDSYTVGLFMAQYMYTPTDLSQEEPEPDDRPYAGWLYTGYQAFRTLKKDRKGPLYERADQYSLSVGVVGESSLAKETQTWVHQVIGSGKPEGWDTQVDETLAIDMMYNHFWKYGFHQSPHQGFGVDLIPYVGTNLGNVFVLGRVGGKARVGYNLPDDFGASAITPTKIGQPATQQKKYPLHWFGFNLFLILEGRGVLHNLLLEGDTGVDGQDIEIKPWVGDLIVGASAQFKQKVSIDYMHVNRTDEFYGQDGSQSFGSLSLTVQF